MRILVLFDVHRPVAEGQKFTEQSLRTDEAKPTEADVLSCLRTLQHEVETLAVYDDAKSVFDRVDAFKPDVVFNLCETFFSDRAHEPNIPALLELLKVPYTGAGPDALMLCKDKALAKELLSFHRIRVARFVVSRRERPLRRLRRFSYPAFVKPIGEEASDGIALASLAKTEDEVLERARFLHDRFETDALIEEYVDGRELYLGVLGNKRLTVFPPREIFFGEAPALATVDGESPSAYAPNVPLALKDAPRFATAKAKWDEGYRKKWGIRNGPAGPLPAGVEKKLAEIARRVCRILHVRGLGRIDARLTAAGDIVVIEANPNPSLAKEDDFAQAAMQVGIGYEALIQKVLENALKS
jgi:D-alanine-D-alanine ligase